MFTYTTPSLITEVLHLVTQVHLLLMTITVNYVIPYTVVANCYGVSAYNVYQFQGLHPLMKMTIVAI